MAFEDCEYGCYVTVKKLVPLTDIAAITRKNPTTAVTNSSSVIFRATFTNQVNGLAVANFDLVPTVTGASITKVTPAGSPPIRNWDITVNTGTGDGTLTLRLANAIGMNHIVSPSDLPFSDQFYTIDKHTQTLFTPTIANVAAGNATLALKTDVPGTGYFTLLLGNNTPCGSGAQTKAGLDSNDLPAYRFGSLPLVADIPGNYTVSNILADTAYTVCFTTDDGGSLQNSAISTNLITKPAVVLDNPGWSTVGYPGFSNNGVDNLSLAFAPDGTPYVAYTSDWNPCFSANQNWARYIYQN